MGNIGVDKYRKKLEKFISIDPKTSVRNFRYFEHHFNKIFETSRKKSTSLTLIIIDIDYLKSVNDAYGFVIGDRVLRQLANLLKSETRKIDLICRYGADEFIIVMPKTNFSRAHNIAENIINKVESEPFGDKKTKVKLTVSIGLCTYPEKGIDTSEQLLNKTEAALSASKDAGGNNVNVGFKPSKESKRFDFKNKKALVEFVHALANTVKAKDRYTQEHSEMMSKVAVELARCFQMSDEEIETVRLGAILHDLGKIGINESILLKPGRLTKEEFEIVKQHPQIGAEIVRTVHALKDAIPLILYHHERHNGSGYLKGLKGKDIPLGARIIGLADVYQALLSDRPYRKAYSKEKAIEIIKQGKGEVFDPQVVEAFLSLVKNKHI